PEEHFEQRRLKEHLEKSLKPSARGSFQPSFSKSLTDKLIAEFTGISEDGKVNLWLVQIVCLLLWQAEDPDELYQQKGEVRGLLKSYFHDALESLEKQELK